MADWQIREYLHPQDYSVVSHLWQTCGGGVKYGRSDSEAEIQKKVLRDPDLFLVATIDDQIIASIIGGYDGRRGMAYHLAVAEQYRGLGVARDLMQELEKRLVGKGCVKAYLMINPEHPDLLDYYAKLGWQQMNVFICAKEF